jgi:hypothetical protein
MEEAHAVLRAAGISMPVEGGSRPHKKSKKGSKEHKKEHKRSSRDHGSGPKAKRRGSGSDSDSLSEGAKGRSRR